MRRALLILPWALIVVAAVPLASSTSHATVTHNRLATNRLATNRLATNRLATNRLATNRLATNGLGSLSADPSAQELLATADGRDVYSYVISCALPAGTDIHATVSGAPDTGPDDPYYTCISEQCTFSGSIGLAPRWIDHKLNKSGQRWVTACLLARVNAHDTVEPISIRGTNAALAITDAEAFDFPLQEGAFYGNLFAKDSTIPDWHSCLGQDQAAGETAGLVDRDCAEPDPMDATLNQCGFDYAGDCADYTPVFASPYTCKGYEPTTGSYSKCHAQPGIKKWPHLKTYKEVITTYVKL